MMKMQTIVRSRPVTTSWLSFSAEKQWWERIGRKQGNAADDKEGDIMKLMDLSLSSFLVVANLRRVSSTSLNKQNLNIFWIEGHFTLKRMMCQCCWLALPLSAFSSLYSPGVGTIWWSTSLWHQNVNHVHQLNKYWQQTSSSNPWSQVETLTTARSAMGTGCISGGTGLEKR